MIAWEDVVDLERDIRETEPNYWIEEESEEEARERMSPTELEADREYEAQREKREGLHLQGKPWRKRRQWTGRVGRCRREGR